MGEEGAVAHFAVDAVVLVVDELGQVVDVLVVLVFTQQG